MGGRCGDPRSRFVVVVVVVLLLLPLLLLLLLLLLCCAAGLPARLLCAALPACLWPAARCLLVLLLLLLLLLLLCCAAGLPACLLCAACLACLPWPAVCLARGRSSGSLRLRASRLFPSGHSFGLGSLSLVVSRLCLLRRPGLRPLLGVACRRTYMVVSACADCEFPS
jgi:hypothetical protein